MEENKKERREITFALQKKVKNKKIEKGTN